MRTPTTIKKGSPTDQFPCSWAIYDWIEGATDLNGEIANSKEAAIALGTFLRTLRGLDSSNGPSPGFHNFDRGVGLLERNKTARESILALKGEFDEKLGIEIWERCLAQPVWAQKNTWLHGDLHGGNLLVDGGKLIGVIDFGVLGVGDPACDVMAAWTLFSSESRETFRQTVAIDDATWERGRGWALSFSAGAYTFYKDTNPILGSIAFETLKRVYSDIQQ